MVIFCPFPVGWFVAVTTFFTVFTIMDIDFLVAAVTIEGCVGVFLFGFMAGLAACLGVHALQAKICVAVIERRLIQQDDFSIPAFMVLVAVTAFGSYRYGQPAMKAFLSAHVVQYVFMVMALHTQLALLFLVRSVVALAAVIFIFFVALDHWTRHQE